MPSQPYDLVKDDQDIRVPLYPEQAFYGNGLTFQAKHCLVGLAISLSGTDYQPMKSKKAFMHDYHKTEIHKPELNALRVNVYTIPG
uniref:Uncharacterized protein n=1 Tax=Anopheles epiroticus TaxID=199890 RepID=A0A182P3K3_9DIPT